MFRGCLRLVVAFESFHPDVISGKTAAASERKARKKTRWAKIGRVNLYDVTRLKYL